MSQLLETLRERFSISPRAEIKRLILLTGEIVDSVELLEKGDRVWVELRIISNQIYPIHHKEGCPFETKLTPPKMDNKEEQRKIDTL
jgi:hypothetical protein